MFGNLRMCKNRDLLINFYQPELDNFAPVVCVVTYNNMQSVGTQTAGGGY
jgi:hypothetical protein